MNLFFSTDVQLKINDTSISALNGCYPILGYLQTLLFFSPDTKNSKLERQGFYIESNPNDNNAFGFDGFAKRFDFTKESRLYHLETPIFHGLCQQSRLIPAMVKLYLALDLAEPTYCIISGVPTSAAANSLFKFVIKNPILRLKRIKTLDSFAAKFEARLLQSPALYPYTHISCRSYVIPAGVKNFSNQDLFGSTFLPKFCYMALSTQTASAGSFATNPLSFSPHGVKDIAIFAQNERIPSLSFQLDYTGDSPNFLRAFTSLFGNDTMMRDSSCGIDQNDFGTYYTIYSFWMTRVSEMLKNELINRFTTEKKEKIKKIKKEKVSGVKEWQERQKLLELERNKEYQEYLKELRLKEIRSYLKWLINSNYFVSIRIPAKRTASIRQ